MKKSWFLLPVIIVGFVIFGCSIDSDGGKRCGKLVDLAKDDKKIRYIESWIIENINNTNLLKELGYGGVIYSEGNPDFSNLLGLDWGFIGIDEEFASISFNRETNERNDFLISTNIKSVSIGDGRSSLIVKVNDSKQLGIPGMEKYTESLIEISDQISVFCSE